MNKIMHVTLMIGTLNALPNLAYGALNCPDLEASDFAVSEKEYSIVKTSVENERGFYWTGKANISKTYRIKYADKMTEESSPDLVCEYLVHAEYNFTPYQNTAFLEVEAVYNYPAPEVTPEEAEKIVKGELKSIESKGILWKVARFSSKNKKINSVFPRRPMLIDRDTGNTPSYEILYMLNSDSGSGGEILLTTKSPLF